MANISVGRKSGFILRGGVRRRETEWFSDVVSENTLAAINTSVLLSVLDAGALALRPFTIVRTRGMVLARSDQTAASETGDLGFGLAVVSDQASAIGVTAVPTPTTDDGSDLWFVYERLIQRYQALDATGFGQTGLVRIIDSRAMRKVVDGQDVVKVAETGPIGGGVTVSSYTRMLVKLH